MWPDTVPLRVRVGWIVKIKPQAVTAGVTLLSLMEPITFVVVGFF